MNQESNELTESNEKKIRLSPRYHLLGNDCLIESSRFKPTLAKIIDVSNSGALIYSKTEIGDAGDQIDVFLRMNINEEDKIFSVRSVIKNVRFDEEYATLMYGVGFVEIDSETAFMLKNYLYKSLTE